MNYQQTLDYLYNKLPMYQRIGPPAMKKDLGNTLALCEFLGQPQEKFKSIHIAGTNGKGSLAHMLASVYQEAGYKTGLYTSPHLLDFRERVRVNGVPVSEGFVVRFTEKIKALIESIQPSFFEITVAMAFEAFAREKVDMAIIETGLGGQLDSTNVVHPEVSLITNISLEHEHMLGNTLEKIAFEKAGIIKPGTPVIVGEKKDTTKTVFEKIAAERNAVLSFSEDIFQVEFLHARAQAGIFQVKKGPRLYVPELRCDLTASYQAANISHCLAALQQLKPEKISKGHIIKAFGKIKENTALQGRWEQIATKPDIICDISHNAVAIEAMLRQLEFREYEKLHIVLGMSNDKKHGRILPLFPLNAGYYFARPEVPRGLGADELYRLAVKHGLRGKAYENVQAALEAAINKASCKDLILVTGSAFVVAEVLV